MPTQRLYPDDSLCLQFDARVLRAVRFGDAPALVLDRSAFYPEGGGQLGDRGLLHLDDGTRIEVIDVQVDDAGEVHHLVAAGTDPAALAPFLDRTVHGEIDEARRRDHMSQHTGQHMLSRALLDAAGAETVSSRLGADSSTIDLGIATLDEARLAEAVARVNAVVLEDRPVRALMPSPEELSRLPLRRTPKVDRDVRVIEVEGFDFSPCGGTHCQRTGQVGPVAVLKTERYKGMTRVTFVAGTRTLADLRDKDAALRALARDLKCGVPDVGAAVARLRNDLRAVQQTLGQVRHELMMQLAAPLLAAHPPREAGSDGDRTVRVIVAREGDDLDSLRTLAGALARRPDVVALVASRERNAGNEKPGSAESGDWIVVIERGAEARFDAGAWLKETARTHAGRGGGRPDHAEGRLPGTVDWPAIAAVGR